MDTQLRDGLERRLSLASFLDPRSNPTILGLQRSADVARDAAAVLTEYCVLPAVITELLSRGVAKLYEWPPVRDELLRNLGEELGTRSNNKSHYMILKNGLAEEASLQLPDELTPSKPTAIFIKRLRNLVSEAKPHAAAGALYALEDSAVPELKVVARLINTYASVAIGRTVISEIYEASPNTGPWSLDRFFAAHIGDFEVGHRDFLAAALDPYLQGRADREEFLGGFGDVMSAMDTWWGSIAKQIVRPFTPEVGSDTSTDRSAEKYSAPNFAIGTPGR